MYTTLSKIKKSMPSNEKWGRWEELFHYIGKNETPESEDIEVSILEILDFMGLKDALACVDCVGYEDKLVQFAFDCVLDLENLMTKSLDYIPEITEVLNYLKEPIGDPEENIINFLDREANDSDEHGPGLSDCLWCLYSFFSDCHDPKEMARTAVYWSQYANSDSKGMGYEGALGQNEFYEIQEKRFRELLETTKNEKYEAEMKSRRKKPKNRFYLYCQDMRGGPLFDPKKGISRTYTIFEAKNLEEAKEKMRKIGISLSSPFAEPRVFMNYDEVFNELVEKFTEKLGVIRYMVDYSDLVPFVHFEDGKVKALKELVDIYFLFGKTKNERLGQKINIHERCKNNTANPTKTRKILTGKAGCGKTFEAFKQAKNLGGRVAYFSPTATLAYESYERYGTENDTLAAKGVKINETSAGNLFSTYEIPWNVDDFDTIIVDEAHMITSDFAPHRNFIREAIQFFQGNIFLATSTINFYGLSDFSIEEIERKAKFRKKKIDQDQGLERIFEGAKTLAIFDRNRESRKFSLNLANMNIKARHIDSSTDELDVLKALKDFKEGKIQVLCAGNIVTYGLNIQFENLLLEIGKENDFEGVYHKIGRLGRLGINNNNEKLTYSIWTDSKANYIENRSYFDNPFTKIKMLYKHKINLNERLVQEPYTPPHVRYKDLEEIKKILQKT